MYGADFVMAYWANIRIRAITYFFISICNLVGYWPICELKLTINRNLKVIIGRGYNSNF